MASCGPAAICQASVTFPGVSGCRLIASARTVNAKSGTAVMWDTGISVAKTGERSDILPASASGRGTEDSG